MVARRYVPAAGDVVWLSFDPGTRHEQAGHRPAVVLSPARYNEKTGMMVCVLMTTQVKGFPFEVAIAGKPAGVALADQVKSVDWRARKAARKGRISDGELAEIRGKVLVLIGG